MEEFRALLRSRIQQRGDLARLAEASGVASPVIGRWLAGDMRPRPEKLALLAPALDIPYEDLLRMCGYLPGETTATEHVNARRRLVEQQLEEWIAAVGPEHEDYLWRHLKAQGDSTVELIRRLSSADNTLPHGADNAAVRAVADEQNSGLDGGEPPIKACYQPISGPLGVLAAAA